MDYSKYLDSQRANLRSVLPCFHSIFMLITVTVTVSLAHQDKWLYSYGVLPGQMLLWGSGG
jgi:hypothetical protein